MPSFETILIVTLAGLALSATPGPSMIYVLSRSVGQNVWAGFASSIGLALGGVILAIFSALGLAIAIKQSTLAYQMISLFGGCYLIYLGAKMILDAGREDLRTYSVGKESFFRILYQGVWVEVLNPKTILFFVAFLPQFIDPANDNATSHMLILGMLVPLTAIPSDIVVSLAGGTLAAYLARNKTTGRYLGYLSGLVLIGLGIRIFLLL
ncbi:MAG: LysE family translocator [Pseudomonadota bacterium]